MALNRFSILSNMNIINDVYTIDVKTNQNVPTFTVTLNHSTINKSIENYPKQVSGFNLKVHDYHQLSISITLNSDFSKSNEMFRGALSMLNKYSLTSRDLEKILIVYDRFLTINGLESNCFGKQSAQSVSYRPNGSAY